jgi:hypothetical protein
MVTASMMTSSSVVSATAMPTTVSSATSVSPASCEGYRTGDKPGGEGQGKDRYGQPRAAPHCGKHLRAPDYHACCREIGRKASRKEALSGFTPPRYFHLRSATKTGPKQDEDFFRIRMDAAVSFIGVNAPRFVKTTLEIAPRKAAIAGTTGSLGRHATIFAGTSPERASIQFERGIAA